MRGHSGQLCHQYPVKYMIAKKNCIFVVKSTTIQIQYSYFLIGVCISSVSKVWLWTTVYIVFGVSDCGPQYILCLESVWLWTTVYIVFVSLCVYIKNSRHRFWKRVPALYPLAVGDVIIKKGKVGCPLTSLTPKYIFFLISKVISSFR
jgi:hypothetical protein